MSIQQSLISKVAEKGIFTPYEAVLLQYLNIKQLKEQTSDALRASNPYIAADSVRSLYNQQDLKQILSFNTLQDAHTYDAYKWAADLLNKYDRDSELAVLRGASLWNELRYFRDEKLIETLTEKSSFSSESLSKFMTFSKVYMKPVTYKQILRAFASALHSLIAIADNVLTLNFFLNGMVDLPDLLCLTNLKSIFADSEKTGDENEQTLSPFSMDYIDKKSLFITTINNNHPLFTEFVHNNLIMLDWKTTPSFEGDSLTYVKRSLEQELHVPLFDEGI
ncbi:MAG: hypothetical protein WC775_02460 [Patescibacteria group bacterium]